MNGLQKGTYPFWGPGLENKAWLPNRLPSSLNTSLEDHPRPCKWLITMVIVSHLNGVIPLINGPNGLYIGGTNWGWLFGTNILWSHSWNDLAFCLVKDIKLYQFNVTSTVASLLAIHHNWKKHTQTIRHKDLNISIMSIWISSVSV